VVEGDAEDQRPCRTTTTKNYTVSARFWIIEEKREEALPVVCGRQWFKQEREGSVSGFAVV
jgi:hypothetical protein